MMITVIYFFTPLLYGEVISHTCLIMNSELPSHAHIEAMVITLLYECPNLYYHYFCARAKLISYPNTLFTSCSSASVLRSATYYFPTYHLSRSPPSLCICDCCNTKIYTHQPGIGLSLALAPMPFSVYMVISPVLPLIF